MRLLARGAFTIGVVEQNPGPSTPEDVLAHLRAEAPSSEIRDSIRLYDQQRDYSTNKKKFSVVPVDILVETMTYLGVPGQDVAYMLNPPLCII